MGKLTDALIKAGRLKGKPAETPAEKTPETPAEAAPKEPEPTREKPKRPVAADATPKLRLVTGQPRTSRTSPVPKEDFVPAQPAARQRPKMTSLIFPVTEPETSPDLETPSESRPVLPEVEPTPREATRTYLSVHTNVDERTGAEFRRLRGQLIAVAPPARVILIGSARPGEGKTALATNLAVSFANTYGERVVLVDGNVARPKIGEVLELADDGLGDVVRSRAVAEDVAAKTRIAGPWAVPAGRTGRRSEGMLASKPVAELLDTLRRRFTRVIVELPAHSDAPEALALASQADVLLIPVMRSRTRRRDLRKLIAKAREHGTARVHCVFIDA